MVSCQGPTVQFVFFKRLGQRLFAESFAVQSLGVNHDMR